MPHTVRVRASLAKHLLSSGDQDLRRRIGILRELPFPPGSRSLAADDELHELATEFPARIPFVYGSADNALVYTYDSSEQVVRIEFAIAGGQIVGRAG